MVSLQAMETQHGLKIRKYNVSLRGSPQIGRTQYIHFNMHAFRIEYVHPQLGLHSKSGPANTEN